MNLEKVNANILYSKITVVKRWDVFIYVIFYQNMSFYWAN